MTITAADDDARARLAAAPVAPRDIDRFTSNELHGESGIYPAGSAMTPADGAALDESAARRALQSVGLLDAVAAFDRVELSLRVPDPGPRAGLAALTGTLAASVLDQFVSGGPVGTIRLGATRSPGRVVGPPDGVDDRGVRVVNDRYRAEHPALLAASLAHDVLWSGDGAGQYEECILHALGAMVHVQLLARAPALASLGTELARRQNSLAITLLNSRHPGSADIALIAPDGPGTIPGGAPAMQTPDFWSVPFVSGPLEVTAAPAGLTPVLAAVLEPDAPLPAPLRYSPELGSVLSTHLGRGWLSLIDQLAAARALGLLS